jgi:hypothetical protein
MKRLMTLIATLILIPAQSAWAQSDPPSTPNPYHPEHSFPHYEHPIAHHEHPHYEHPIAHHEYPHPDHPTPQPEHPDHPTPPVPEVPVPVAPPSCGNGEWHSHEGPNDVCELPTEHAPPVTASDAAPAPVLLANGVTPAAAAAPVAEGAKSIAVTVKASVAKTKSDPAKKVAKPKTLAKPKPAKKIVVSETLPFTGLPLALYGLVGLLLIGLGLAVRRAESV